MRHVSTLRAVFLVLGWLAVLPRYADEGGGVLLSSLQWSIRHGVSNDDPRLEKGRYRLWCAISGGYAYVRLGVRRAFLPS